MLQVFGFCTVVAMLATYGLEHRSHWYVVGFYVSCLLGALYCLLQGAWPFAAGEFAWAALAFWRWVKALDAPPRRMP